MSNSSLIRLVMPQWQGGDNPAYYLGGQLLNWLAPVTESPVVTVPVQSPEDNTLQDENGIVGRAQVVKQLKAAEQAIENYSPEKIVVLGGDCLVDLSPFAYLSRKYGKKFGILWVDAHPDVMTPEQFNHSHAHVISALMGKGDPDLTSVVDVPVVGQQVMMVGLNDPTDYEVNFLEKEKINHSYADTFVSSGEAVSEWIQREDIQYLAIHFDLDVLNYKNFHSVLFADPDVDEKTFEGIGKGSVELDQVVELIRKVAEEISVVGIGITEHLPWDAINLKTAMEKLPLLTE